MTTDELRALMRPIRRKRKRQPRGSAYSILLAYMLYRLSERIRRLERDA